MSGENLINKVREEARGVASLIRSHNKLVGVALPVAIGSWALLKENFSAQIEIFWIVLAVLALAQVILGAVVFNVPLLATEVYHIYEEEKGNHIKLQQHVDELYFDLEDKDHSINVLYIVNLYSEASLEIVRQTLHQKEDVRNDYTETVTKVMEFVIGEKETFFTIEDDNELWNFSVYLQDGEDGLLKPVWRKRSPKHPSQGMGREFDQGQGHVGKAFADEQVKITADSSEQESMLSLPEHLRQEYDGETYISYVSVPIMSPRDQRKPYGVIVATSDIPNRFEESNSVILQNTASILGIYLDSIGFRGSRPQRGHDGTRTGGQG